VRAASRLARVRAPSAAALARERWITFPPAAGRGHEPYASAVERGLAACGVDPGEFVLIDSLTAQKRMVEAGFGLARLQASSVDEELRAGTLTVLRAPVLRATIPVVLIQRRRVYLPGAARALAARLAADPPRGGQAGVRRSRPSR
jgi:DNA-binding transcriptional LysR family regulator